MKLPQVGKSPSCVITDDHCEELAFPQYFSKGRFGYKRKRAVKLSPVRYFNQRLLNYKQMFSSCADYIFFAQFVIQQLSLCGQINIAMRKATGAASYTAGMFSNYKETVQSIVKSDLGYTFMNYVKGSPAFWKRFQLEVLAMIRQLGCPTLFFTLSCADLRWNELIHIISLINGLNLTTEDIASLNYFERCEILNNNPVLVARHFQYRLEVLFVEILMIPAGPLGEIKYYAFRVEFQFRGSPHIHSFIWILNAPKLTDDNIGEYIEFLDSKIQAYLPDEAMYPELYNFVKTYQVHKHSKSCCKYKNVSCRYGYGRYFTEWTIIAKPINIPDDSVYIYAENYLKDELNEEKLNLLNSSEVVVYADDTLPSDVCESKIQKALNGSISDTGGLSKQLCLKSSARVMITSNINIEDRLINGKMGTVFGFKYSKQGCLLTVYVKLDDSSAGLQTMRKDNYAFVNNAVPINKIESKIYIAKFSLSFIKRVQFPLTLAWACTVHKVQGLTLPNIVFSFKLNK